MTKFTEELLKWGRWVLLWLIRSVIYSSMMVSGLLLLADVSVYLKAGSGKLIVASIIFLFAGDVYRYLTKKFKLL